MKLSKKTVIIIAAVLVFLISGGIAIATNIPTVRTERQLNLGNRYLQEGKYQEAILAYQKVIEIEPKNIPARLGLGNAYIATEEFAKAEAILKEVIDIDPNNIPAREELFKVYVKEGNLDAANTILQEINNTDPNMDVKQMKADIESAIAMSHIVYTPDNQYLKYRKSNGITYRDIMLACYLDTSKNIAYYGAIEGQENSVIRVHNPKISPISAIPSDTSDGNDKQSKSIGTQFHATKTMIFGDVFGGDYYFPVIMEGNDFEGDLVKSGIQPDYYVYVDK